MTGDGGINAPPRRDAVPAVRRRVGRSGDLGKYEQGLFLHIPSTAAHSFTRLLRADTAIGKVLRIHDEGAFPALVSASEYELVHTHLPYPVARILRQPLLILTFLGQPVDRTISLFEHRMRETVKPLYARWQSERMNVPEDLVLKGAYSNRQTMLLGADFDLRPIVQRFEAGELTADEARDELQRLMPVPDRETLNRAKARLEEIQFIGLTEAYDDSVRLFAKVIGMESAAISGVNAGPESKRETRALRYDQGTLSALAEANRLDQELYDFGVELFKRRYEDAFGEPPRVSLSGELDKRHDEIERLRVQIRELDVAAAWRLKAMEAIEREAASARLELEIMRSSRSWRLTRPVRAAGRAVRRVVGARKDVRE